MKSTLLLLFACSAVLTCAQPATQWSRTAGGFDQYEPYHSAIDPTGGLYTCGYGETVRDYGSGVTVVDNGFAIARYDVAGTVLWARPLTTEHVMEVYVDGIATTSTGDLWVSGYFNSDSLVIDGFTLTSVSQGTGFIARFDNNGDAQFATAWGGPGGYTTHFDICTDAQDRVYVVGSSTATNIDIDGVSLMNSGFVSQMVALRFSANGFAEWGSMSSYSLADAEGLNVAVDEAGDIFATVRFDTTLVVEGMGLTTNIIDDIALVKFTPAGNTDWMHAVAVCDPLDLAVDAEGNSYVCGDIQYEADFDGDILVPSVLDGFVSAYTSEGDYRWVVAVHGDIDNELCWSVELDSAQASLVVGGTFVISASFGTLEMSTGTSPTDGFIMHMDTAGTVDWVKDMTGDGPTLFAEAHLGSGDELYASGVTQSLTTYLGRPVLNANGNQAFLARFDDLTTGIPSVAEDPSMQLRPNPTSGTFTIDLPADARSVIITDALGRMQQQVPIANTNIRSFQIGTPGVYFVTVLTKTDRYVQKVVVE